MSKKGLKLYGLTKKLEVMFFDKQLIVNQFKLKPFGSKGWMRSNLLICPSCGQSDEFAINFSQNGGVLHCLHSKTCNNYSISLYNYLKKIGKDDLIENNKAIDFNKFVSFRTVEEEINKESILSIKKLPIGFKELKNDDYLNSRNFLPLHYEMFKVGESKIDPNLRGHLIFQFFNEENELIAWMSRSRESKEWHKKNIEDSKKGLCGLRLRYHNSPNTEFSLILGGNNEVTEKTHTLIIVEGIMDKVNVDCKLGLLEDENIKCVFTFGNKISIEQIALINKHPNICTIYLMYDYGTIEQSKHTGLILLKNTKNKKIKVCDIKKIDADPGTLGVDELCGLLETSMESFEFNYNKMNGIKQ